MLYFQVLITIFITSFVGRYLSTGLFINFIEKIYVGFYEFSFLPFKFFYYLLLEFHDFYDIFYARKSSLLLNQIQTYSKINNHLKIQN